MFVPCTTNVPLPRILDPSMPDSLIHSLAGATGGIVAMTATYPLVFISTRAAVETRDETKDEKSTRQAVLDIIKREGVTGLYSGLSSSLLGIAVTNGVYYYFYERSREMILNRKGGKALSTAESMLTGLIAGSATTIISNPIWVVQTSQAVHTLPTESHELRRATAKKLGLFEAIQKIMAKDGIGAFWRGVGPALVLVINPVLQYTVFEQLKNFLISRRTQKLRAAGAVATAIAVLSDWDFFLLGAISKLVATGLTYPYIVVKSRLQAGAATALKYKSSIDGLLTILREEGVEGLYKGLGSKLVQSVLTAAILFAGQRRIFELTKNAITSLR